MKRAQARQIIKFAAAAGIGLALIYFIIVGPKLLGTADVSANAKSTVSENRVDNIKSDKNISDFEKAIQSKDSRKIRKHYEKLKLDNSGPVIIQMDRLSKRIRLLRLLHELETSVDSESFGMIELLDCYAERERLAIQHGAFNSADNLEFIKVAEEMKNQNSEAASIATSLANISRFLATESTDERSRLRELAHEFFDSLALEMPQKTERSAALAEQVQLVLQHGIVSEGLPFASSFVEAYSDSSSPTALTNVETFRSMLKTRKRELPDIINSRSGMLERKTQQLMIQANSFFADSSDQLDASTVESLLLGIRDLIRLGRFRFAKELIDKLETRVEKDGRITAILGQLKGAVSLADSIFDPTGLTSPNGQRAPFERFHGRQKVLLFVSDERRLESTGSLSELQKHLSIETGNWICCLVYVDSTNNPVGLSGFKELANKYETKLLILKTNSPEGRQFQQRIPVNNTPFILLLNDRNAIAALDPPINRISEILGNQNHTDSK